MIRIKETQEHHWLYNLTKFYYPQRWVKIGPFGWWHYYYDEILERIKFRDLKDAQEFVDHQLSGGDRTTDIWRKEPQ